jgi:hypothetical protein
VDASAELLRRASQWPGGLTVSRPAYAIRRATTPNPQGHGELAIVGHGYGLRLHRNLRVKKSVRVNALIGSVFERAWIGCRLSELGIKIETGKLEAVIPKKKTPEHL